LRDTVALERAGLGTRFDVLQAQVQLANNQQQLTSSLGTQQINRRTLAQILSISPSIDLAAADPVQIAGRWPLSLEETIVLAFRNRAELEQFLAQRQVAEQQKKAILATLGPTLALNVQYDTINNVRTDLGFGNGYVASLQMQWNFFQGGAVRAQANQQEANKAIAESNFANARNQIRLQVETAYSNLGTSFQNIDTSRQAVVAAREALRLARLRFQAGVGTQTDVINSENNLTTSEGNLVNSILSYNRALAQLTRAVTNLPIATGAAIPAIPTDTPFTSTPPAASPPPATNPVSPPTSTPPASTP
jgi:OMF family outer membrane factor